MCARVHACVSCVRVGVCVCMWNANRTSVVDSCWGDAVALAVAVRAALGVAGAEVVADSAVGELGRTAAELELEESSDSAGGESDRTGAAEGAAPSTGLRRG